MLAPKTAEEWAKYVDVGRCHLHDWHKEDDDLRPCLANMFRAYAAECVNADRKKCAKILRYLPVETP